MNTKKTKVSKRKKNHIKSADILRSLMTQAEAAKRRGVTRAAIVDLVNRGRLRSVELFGRRLVYRTEVEAFQKGRPGPKPKESE